MRIYVVFINWFGFTCILYPNVCGYRRKRMVMNTENKSEVMEYLHDYGYLENTDNMTDAELKQSVMDFQYFIGVNPSGTMDKETINMMDRPRCGKPDMARSRTKRYTFFGNKRWEKPELLFSVDKYTNDLNEFVVNNELQRALNVWSEHTKIQFKPSDGKHSDLSVTFVPQDGEGRTVGYAEKPTHGAVILDEDEKWTKQSFNGINLFQVAVHEFGHSLGLGHSDNIHAVMFPYYMGYKQNFALHEDDIRGIETLYKSSTGYIVANLGDNTILCQNVKIDAIFTTTDNYLYLLKADKYWKLTSEFVLVDGPKNISDRWPEVPSNLDAAFTASNNITYFFKGPYLWKYNLDKKSGKSKLISVGFRGIPNDLDAALMWNGNGKMYFFKAENYWMFDGSKPPNMRVKHTYPQPISRWNGLPNNLDAAVAVRGFSYFFKGGKYYKYNDMNQHVDNGYPKSTDSLFGCN